MQLFSLKAIPNALSALRLLLGLVFPWIPPSGWLLVVAFAAVTDLADGCASRLFHAASETGRILDPVADKVFILGVVATLIAVDRLSWWETALIGLRDLGVVVGGTAVIIREGWEARKRLYPRLLGKLATGLQFAFLIAVLADLPMFRQFLLIATAIVGGLAVADYILAYFTRPTAT